MGSRMRDVIGLTAIADRCVVALGIKIKDLLGRRVVAWPVLGENKQQQAKRYGFRRFWPLLHIPARRNGWRFCRGLMHAAPAGVSRERGYCFAFRNYQPLEGCAGLSARVA